jgi:hypothetical protein
MKPLKVDFTGSVQGFEQYDSFNHQVVERVRSSFQSAKFLIVIDRAYGIDSDICEDIATSAFVVRDHLNLTGTSPLLGPNHPCGERFTPLNDIYVNHLPNSHSSVITAGLLPDLIPSLEEKELLKSIGAECWCYNLVPTVLVAAHAGFKTLGILVAEANSKIQLQLETILSAVPDSL